MSFIFESVRVRTHLICTRKPDAISQDKNSLVSFLSLVLEYFLVKHGFSLPKKSFVQASSLPPLPQKPETLERYQFDDSGYAESTPIGEMSLEDQHHMLVPDLSTTFYTTPARLTFTLPKSDSLVSTKRGSNVEPGLVPTWLEHAFKVCLSFVLVFQIC